MATRAQKITFINKYVRGKGGKRYTRAMLETISDETLDRVCDKFADDFRKFCELSSVKLIKFLCDGIDENGDMVGIDGKAASEEEFRQRVMADGIKIRRVVKASGNHRCMYCNAIAEGSYKELLCSQCREDFGHALITEL